MAYYHHHHHHYQPSTIITIIIITINHQPSSSPSSSLQSPYSQPLPLKSTTTMKQQQKTSHTITYVRTYILISNTSQLGSTLHMQTTTTPCPPPECRVRTLCFELGTKPRLLLQTLRLVPFALPENGCLFWSHLIHHTANHLHTRTHTHK